MIRDWSQAVKFLREKEVEVFGYINNHFAGYTPASVEMFRQARLRLQK